MTAPPPKPLTPEELLPCPFCGGEATECDEPVLSVESAKHLVGCWACGVRFTSWHKIPQRARAAWNRRAHDASQRAEIERLRTALERIATEHQSYDDPAVRSRDTSYSTGITDGHRCAASIARAALAPQPGGEAT